MTKKNFLNNALLHHLSIQSPNPEGLSKFYSYTIGMEQKAITHQKKSKWMCFGNDRRIIFSLGEKKKLDFAAFSLKGNNNLNDFKEIVLSNSVEIEDFETPFFEKGSFSVKDPDGNVLVFGLSNNKEGIAYSSTYKDSIYGASKADIWRYCILHEFGGVYLDFDSSIEFSLNSIPSDVDELISFEKNKVSSQISKEYTPDYDLLSKLPKKHDFINHPENLVIQWLLIFKKEHPILKLVIEEIEKNYDFFKNKKFSSAHMAIVNFTAPVILTKVVWDYVKKNNKICQRGIDFNNKVTFKNISKNGVYFNDDTYYKKYSNTEILLNNPIRLNLGCGDDVKKEYINIDAVKNKENIIHLDINNLKSRFKNSTIHEIYAKDVLEHVGLLTAKKWISDWSNLLIIGGTLTIQTTCLDLIIEAYKKNFINEEKLNCLLFAGVYWENSKPYWDNEKTTHYDWHQVCFSKKLLFDELKKNNFSIVAEKYDQISKNSNGLNMTIKAKKVN